jgi:hypothetical protein
MTLTVARQEEALRAALGRNAKGRKALAHLEKESRLLRLIAKRQFAKYIKAGGDGGNWQAFLDWLVKNLPAIIAMIMALFA